MCETNIDECKLHNACANKATCTDKINDYECDCTGTGYKGKNCSVEVNECDANPCKNGANCTDALKNYTCSCHPGYTGMNCSVDINECSPNPCKFNCTCLQKSDASLYGKKNMAPFNGNFSYDKAAGFVCECVNGTKVGEARISAELAAAGSQPCPETAQRGGIFGAAAKRRQNEANAKLKKDKGYLLDHVDTLEQRLRAKDDLIHQLHAQIDELEARLQELEKLQSLEVSLQSKRWQELERMANTLKGHARSMTSSRGRQRQAEAEF